MPFSFKIREKRVKDGSEVARVVFEAFRDKYLALAGDQPEKALEIVTEEMKWRGRAENFFVAESDGKIAGAIEILATDIRSMPNGERISIYLEHLGLAQGLKSLYLLSLLGRALGPEEACVSQIAVSPEYQRRGIARALLARGEEFSRNRNKKIVLLWVAESNTPSVRLYESAGYEQVRKTGSPLQKRFFGREEWIEFRKDLK